MVIFEKQTTLPLYMFGKLFYTQLEEMPFTASTEVHSSKKTSKNLQNFLSINKMIFEEIRGDRRTVSPI